MKVAIFTKHWGLAELLDNVLEDHDTRIVNAETFPLEYQFKKAMGDEDVFISCMPHEDLKGYTGNKPVIIYATDPIYQWVWDDVVRVQKEPWCKVVVAEDCFPQHFFPITPEFIIPFAINHLNYKPYSGRINRVAIVNRKARDRWQECVRGANGIAYSLEEFLGDIPFDIVTIPDNLKYRQTLGDYKVMFYFSNSPYTIVLFEGMAIKMPMVGFNHNHESTYKPVEKYLNRFSTDRDQVRAMLKDSLDSKPITEEYNNVLSFKEIKRRWNSVLEQACATK